MPEESISPYLAELFKTSVGILRSLLRELQEINYPILWGGHLARPVYMAGKMPLVSS
ncbi:MAG: hypothetical protein V7L00_25155 [Nostoc sp.]|uniref:hypothetical protein n=1 Tax=Nostoc sp. TaxID=1180 RepID=UPI002FF66451